MNNFLYYAPTAVYFGKNSEEKLAEILQRYGFKKVLIHYGGESAVKSGLLTRIKWGIERAKIAYCELGGVKPNPRLSLVNQGISLCQRENVDLILAVGGGSVIDSAKAIGLGVASGGDVWDFYSRKREAAKCLPIGVVLTISASGSAMSNSSVITNDEICEKRTDFRHTQPRFDGERFTLPDCVRRCGYIYAHRRALSCRRRQYEAYRRHKRGAYDYGYLRNGQSPAHT